MGLERTAAALFLVFLVLAGAYIAGQWVRALIAGTLPL